MNKAPGPDCISAEHLLYADESLRFFLSELFNMCIVHGYIPNSGLNTTIVLIRKNKNGNMSDTSNYRPVAVATVVSKLLEHFILSSISFFLGITETDNQFGFKADHSTDQCTFVRWLQRILDVCQAYAKSHGIIFNCNKTVCMMFKVKSAKNTATPLLKLGGQYIKSVDKPIQISEDCIVAIEKAPPQKKPMCAKLCTLAASNNRVHGLQSLYYCLFAPRIYIAVLCAHPVRGESHIQRNDTREVATVLDTELSDDKDIQRQL